MSRRALAWPMTISISSPQAAVAATPYLLGFQPEDSLVILFTQDDGVRMTMRVDLPPVPDFDWLQAVLSSVPDPLPQRALILAYANTVDAEIAGSVADWVMQVLLPLVDVVDVLLITDDRMFSRICEDWTCCDPCGVPLASLRDHQIVAECVAAGMAPLPDRHTLIEQMAPIADDVSSRVAKILLRRPRGEYEARRDRLERQSCKILVSTQPISAPDVACIARSCGDVHVRDPLISILLDGHQAGRIRLGDVRHRMTYVLTRTPESHAGAVAATLALLSWADGDGAAALVAADRALDCDPTNSLAPLVAQALQFGLPPSTWSSVTKDIPMEILRGRRSA